MRTFTGGVGKEWGGGAGLERKNGKMCSMHEDCWLLIGGLHIFRQFLFYGSLLKAHTHKTDLPLADFNIRSTSVGQLQWIQNIKHD